MRNFTFFSRILLSVFLVVFGLNRLNAQNDTLKLSLTDDMYSVITSDTVAGGAFAHDVYLLPRGAVYLQQLQYEIYHDIEIVGAPGPKDVRPAMIIPRSNATGDYMYGYFLIFGEGTKFTMKDVLIQGRTAESDLEALYLGNAIDVKGKNVRLILDRVIINGIRNNAVYVGRDGVYAKITNCSFRNIVDMGDDYTGNAIVDWSAVGWRDSLIIQNNTFLNIGASAVYMGESAYRALVIDHNTIVGTSRTPVGLKNHNIVMTNNVLVGGKAYGNPLNENSVNPLADSTSLIWADTITDRDQLAMMEEHFGMTDADRIFQLHNNMQYFPRFEVEDWQTLGPGGEPCMHQIFLSGYVDTIFNAYAGMDYTNNFGILRSPDALKDGAFDPQFANNEESIKTVLQEILTWERLYRNNEFYAYYKSIDEEGKKYNLAWPLPEDLSYSNTQMLTGSTTGGPVGDLNWIDDIGSAVNDARSFESNFNLNNYPNPFSGMTTIKFSLEKSSEVRLSVFDLTGKEVAVLVNELKSAGDHQVQWDGNSGTGTMPAGIYLYKIRTNTGSEIQRMIKL